MKAVPIIGFDGDEKERKTAEGRSLYIALAALAVGIIAVGGVIIVALLKYDVIGDDEYKVQPMPTLSPQERLEQTRAALQEQVGSNLEVTLHTKNRVARATECSPGPCPTVTLTSYSNWDGTATRDAVFVVAPTNLNEIKRVLLAARLLGLKVRCVGSAYSFSDLLADEGQLLLETNKLKTKHDGPAIELNEPVDGGDWTVTAVAGLDQGELREFFLDNNVQYRSTVTPFNVLLGGLIGTSCHGASAVRGSISDLVIAARVVDAKGKLRSYNSLQHPEEMAMLKCCVGMCGVIYDVTFKVEPLSVATVDNSNFPSSYDLFSDTAALINELQTTDMLFYWAPLSSLTEDQWQEYSVTGKIPSSYDPWLDKYWRRSYKATGQTPLPGRRRRSKPGLNLMPPLVTGHISGLPLDRHRRDVTNTTEAPIYTALRDIHQVVFEFTFNLFNGMPTVDLPFPEAVMFQDGSTMDITYSMAFTFKDDAVLSNTKSCITFVLEKMKQEALNGSMPVITMELDWVQPSRQCYLCAQSTAQDDTDATYWFSLTFIGAFYKPDYQPFMTKIFNDLKEEFPTMRVEWAKFYSFVDGLQPFIRDSFGDGMQQFKDTHAQSGVDADSMFTNEYLRGIFD